MKNSTRIRVLSPYLFVVLCLVLAGSVPAWGQVTVNVFADEFGNGSSTSNGVTFNPLTSFFAADPSGGLGGNVLYYMLPFSVLTQGDVVLSEPTTGNSDVVRFFNNIQNQSFLIFYSDNGDGTDSTADTGLPTQLSGNAVTIGEVGGEGANGATYIPTSTQPGRRDGSVQYNITSDGAVPEPSTVTLMAMGLVAIAALVRRRRRA